MYREYIKVLFPKDLFLWASCEESEKCVEESTVLSNPTMDCFERLSVEKPQRAAQASCVCLLLHQTQTAS